MKNIVPTLFVKNFPNMCWFLVRVVPWEHITNLTTGVKGTKKEKKTKNNSPWRRTEEKLKKSLKTKGKNDSGLFSSWWKFLKNQAKSEPWRRTEEKLKKSLNKGKKRTCPLRKIRDAMHFSGCSSGADLREARCPDPLDNDNNDEHDNDDTRLWHYAVIHWSNVWV